jgi:hypothetical protein
LFSSIWELGLFGEYGVSIEQHCLEFGAVWGIWCFYETTLFGIWGCLGFGESRVSIGQLIYGHDVNEHQVNI